MKVQIVKSKFKNNWYNDLNFPIKCDVEEESGVFYKVVSEDYEENLILKCDCINDEEYKPPTNQDLIDMEIIKNVEEFKSGAKRENKDHKSRPDLISPYFSERLGFVLAKGADAHGERNWEKGIPNESFLASLERHLLAYKQSISKGYTSNNIEEDHLGNLAFNLMGLIHNEEINKLK